MSIEPSACPGVPSAESWTPASPSAPYNAAVDLLERNSIPARCERTYLRDEERSHSYGEIIERSRRFGSGLIARGLSKGARLLIVAGDSVEFVCSFWGAIRVGIVPVPVAPSSVAADFEFVLQDSGAAAIVFDANAEALIAGAASGAAVRIAIASSRLAGAVRWEDVVEPSPAPVDTTLGDVAFWLYTSGTTGSPKAALHTHANLRMAAHGQASQVLGLGAEDTILSASRMFFAYGLGNSVYLPAAVGASVVVNTRQAVPRLIQSLIDTYEPTVLFAVGSFYAQLVALPEANAGKLRVAVSGGEGLPPRTLAAFIERFGVPLLESLGLTEAMHHVTSTRPGELLPGSVGPALEGYGVEIRSAGGHPVAEGVAGEVWVRGPTLFTGYWNRPELTARTLVDGWFRTGDWGTLSRGRLFLDGRVDDMMKVGGMWVLPREVEEVLSAHPDVDDAAVVQTSDASGTPLLRALFCSARRDEKLTGELLRACQRVLPSFKVPRQYQRVDELPRTSTGKLRRRSLRDPQ